MCPRCYKPDYDTYCTNCRKQLFDGVRVSHVLPFDAPKADNFESYQEKNTRLSISGVQLKYSLHLNGKQLALTDHHGQYILKPVPLTAFIVHTDQAPENEHLTMQIASQVFGIQTALNALIYFKDGTPAYITRRFDVKKDGTKYLQEDMAQISGRTRQSAGEHFKYKGSYEEIGHLIRKYVAAAPLALESFFRIILFNYIFSNGDAHMRNFSLIQSEMGDYTLTPAYDLMCTVIHSPMDEDTALDLYKGDIASSFYSTYGYFGRENFEEFAKCIGINQVRANRIIEQLLSLKEKVNSMIEKSFLSDEIKEHYKKCYEDKVLRLEK